MSLISRALQVPAWTEDALCAQVDPALFFPEKGGATTDAKSICAACPVRQQCLDYALAYEAGERDGADWMASFGIYGGLSAQERRKILRERKAARPQAGEAA